MKNTFTKIQFITPVVLLVVLVPALFFLYNEIYTKNEKAEQDLAALHVEANRRQNIKLLNSSLTKIESERLELDQHFAKSSDIVPFLDTLEKLGPLVGAKAEVKFVDTTTSKDGLIVGLSATGSFEAIYKFLTLLENSPYELEFLGVDIRKGAGGGEGAPGKTFSPWEATFKIQLLSYIP